MAIAWFICPYKRRKGTKVPTRYCAMDDFTNDIKNDGGAWAETEILGGEAIVKVRTSSNLIDTISQTKDFIQLPKSKIDDSLADISTNAKQIIKNKALALGYSLEELQTKLPNDLSNYTLKDALIFLATRRLKPRYDSNTDEIICDGEEQSCRTIESVDKEVT